MIDKARLLVILHSPRTRKNALRFLAAFLLVGVLGFLVLPPIVKSLMLDHLAQALHRPVTVGSVAINPYRLSITLEDVSVKESDGNETFVGFDRLYVNLEAASLFRGGVVIGELQLVNPKLRIVRLDDKHYNFSDLIETFSAGPKGDAPPPRFSLNNLQLSGGRIEFDDLPLKEQHVISEIKVSLPFMSSMAYAMETFVEPEFTASVDGAPLAIKGKSKPFADSRESELAFDVSSLKLSSYVDYVPGKLPFEIVSGAVDTRLRLVFREEKNEPSTLALSGSVTLNGLKVRDASGSNLVSFKQLDVEIGSADLIKRKIVIDRIAVDAPEIGARATRQGTLNWADAFAGPPATGKAAASPAPVPAAASAPSPFEWSLGELTVAQGALRWLDESRGKPIAASIEGLDLKLGNLDSKGAHVADFSASWRGQAEDRLTVDAAVIKGGKLDLARRELHIGELRHSGVRAFVRRGADGEIDWLKPPALRVAKSVQKDDAPAWKVNIEKYVGDAIGLRLEDKSVSPAATQSIDALGFEVTNLSTEAGQSARLAARFKLNGKGDVTVNGTLRPLPLDADLNLEIKTLELLPLQPYFAERLNIAVTRGSLTLNGNVKLHQDEATKSGGEPVLSGGFSGQATIGDFYAVDKINSADFLRWKSFYFGKVEFRLKPDSVTVGDIALSDFFARVIVSPEGKLNLLQIVRQPATPAVEVVPDNAARPPPSTATAGSGTAVAAVPEKVPENKPLMPVKIGKITLQGGTVRFTDNFVKPNYTANLQQIGGSLSGLSSDPGTTAKLELRGRYDNVSPLNISARINPLSPKPYLDLQAEITDIELTPFSAYSGKYAGYAIEKGKLSLTVKYKIENEKLEAENRVFLDQLTFGDRVESPDATKLPVTLAVSLLKNRKGEIDINLPISGSLNDPQFSVGGLVVKVIVNLLVKAVTSPFALLGSMFGSGEELSNVEFDAGHAALTPAAEKRLAELAKALTDRPALKLELEGRVDPQTDREGLKSARIERKVRALKREDLTRKGAESGSAETVEVSASEYPALLERVYSAEKFPKPRNMVGMAKSLPVEEMQKLMLANSTVDDDDLLGLGDRRAKAVRDWLLAHEVGAERVFLRPSMLAPAKKEAGADEKAKGSRVDFSLK